MQFAAVNTNELEREYIFQEIGEQPAIARLRAEAPAPAWPAVPGRVLVTGAGDSLCVAELIAALYPGRRIEALPGLHASAAALGLGEGDALIGISVSGRTPRVREALLRAREQGARTVAVTDDPASPLAEAAGDLWLIGASPAAELADTEYASADAREYVGYHHDVAQTKTFLAAVLTLARAVEGGSSGGTDWERLAELVAELVRPAFFEPIGARAEALASAGQAFFLGSLGALPLARFGAYKLFEFNRLAHFADVEEYCHTHYFVTRPGDAVVFLVADRESARRAGEVGPVLAELFEARVVVLRAADVETPWAAGEEVAVPAGGSPLERHVALAVAVEWLAYLWGRIGARDVNTFHAGFDTERLVGASLRTIRRSRIVVAP